MSNTSIEIMFEQRAALWVTYVAALLMFCCIIRRGLQDILGWLICEIGYSETALEIPEDLQGAEPKEITPLPDA